ncbi:MAG: alpha-amylase family glycosyl hydrolase [Polyangiales bacterium]
MKTRTMLGALCLAGATALGCWSDLDDYAGENVPLTANATTDWRDEVIYQLLVDRFADGDTSNDVRIDRGALGRYQGGDWQGVIDHMGYLKELGVTTLWISPIVRNVDTDAGFDAYHGYWASDLTRLNPHFGDLATLRRMVRVAHDNGIKVILDIVTNHMGQMFYYDINNNGRPDEWVEGSGPDYPYRNPGGVGSTLRRTTEYDPDFNSRGPVQGFTSLGPAGDAPVVFLNMPDIFRVPPQGNILASQSILGRPEGYHRRGRITAYDNVDSQPGEQVLLGDFPGGLKDVATEREDVRRAMVEAYWRWVRMLDLDGFRIDTLKHVDHGFWQYFGSNIRRLAAAAGKRNFFMFGEAFDGDDRLVGSYTGPNEMDSVFYFPQKYRVFDNIFQCGDGNTSDIENLYRDRMNDFSGTPQPMGVGVPPRQLLVNFMDNHDVSRFLYGLNPTVASDISRGGRDCSSGVVDSRNPRDIERFRPRLHAALAYLLTEDGIPCIYYGTEQDFHGGNDPSNRERLWETNFATAARRPNNSLSTFGWTQRLIQTRLRYPALRRGAMSLRWTTAHTGAEQDAGIVAFERVDGQNYALVVIHAKDGMAETSADRTGGMPMMVSAAPGTELVDVLADTNRAVTVGSGGSFVAPMGPWQASVFIPRSQVRR